MNTTSNQASNESNNETIQQALVNFCLRLGDSNLIIGQRLCQFLGTAPTLEEEVASANIGLDYLGQAHIWLDLAGQLEGKGRDADQLAYFRDEREYTNFLLCERETKNFAEHMLRIYCFSHYLYQLYQVLQTCSPAPNYPATQIMVELSVKALKEVKYHVEHSRLWIVRLGGGTVFSQQKMQSALEQFYPYCGEMFQFDDWQQGLQRAGFPALDGLQSTWLDALKTLCHDANLTLPETAYQHIGGIYGQHSEALGFVLAEMQTLARQHPGASW